MGEGRAQEALEKADQQAQIQRWVKELDSSNFSTRTSATKSLRQAGVVAIPSLTAALKTAGLESGPRIESILKRLQQNTFAGRVQQLIKLPSAKVAEGLPGWDRFSKSVGSDQDSIDFYIRLLNAEPALFTIAFNDPSGLRTALLQRANELIPQKPRPLEIDSFAAVLFLASDDNVTLRGATSHNITTMLTKDFASALKSKKDGARYLQLAGDWILRRNIAVGRPLNFARTHKMQQGPILARRTLQGVLRANEGIEALMLLKDQGTTADIALVESLFDPKNPGYNNRSDRGVIFKGQNTGIQYTCCYGDLALAVAITMRGAHPHDFGFHKSDPNVTSFAFNENTIGFESEDARQAARERYFAKFQQ